MTIFQIVAKCNYSNIIEMRNIHHYEFADYQPDLTQLQEFVDGVDAAYKTYLSNDLVNDLTIYGYDVRRVDVGDLPAVEYLPTAGAWAGISGGEPLPSQISAVVTFKAISEFPRSTRTYMFPLSENENSSTGVIAPSMVAKLQDWANAMMSITIAAAGDAFKVAVRYGGDPRVVTDLNRVEFFKVTNVWATQRRRRRGVGV